MGDPIEEYEPGNMCVNCWGTGKSFGDYPTPKRIYIEGSGFAGPAAVCNGKFIADQDAVNPCLWSFDDGSARGYWLLTHVSSTFSMGISGGTNVYFKVEGLCEKVSFLAPEKVEVT